MKTHKMAVSLMLMATTAGSVLAAAAPASAGGAGDFLSPAFGTDCANHHRSQADGATTAGTGAANGNLLGLPVGSPFNQCGGADLTFSQSGLVNVGLADFVNDAQIPVLGS
ncbi:hypothetical protein [Streptomyces rubiginosohelvolus]